MNDIGRVRFGLFEFDPATGELRRGGAAVRLQPQPAQVLALLVEHAGEVVAREMLRDAVWGGGTYVDFDRGLNFCIAQLRAALGDTADSPRFVRTLPKRGYQFIAPIEPLERAGDSQTAHNDSESGTAPDTSTLHAGRRAGRRRLVVAVAIVAVMAVGFAGGRWWSGTSPTAQTTIAVVRFDNETANPDFDRFADALTDTLVAQLTASGQGRYQVIGNAAILRAPRERRDLNAIAASLGVGYVVLGQVQLSGGRVRVLAHLIRMPEQTHVWVTRLDRQADDPLALQLELAQTIASDLSRRLSVDRSRPNAQPSSSKAAND
jgi:DNA-binding winged helix-turn-helix (wHTH) protein/TolB-like protein